MTNGNEQRRQLFPCRRCGDHSFSVIKASLENQQDELTAKAAVSWWKINRFHNFPGRSKIALRSVGLGELSWNLEIAWSNGARALESGARLFEAAETAIAAPNIHPDI